MIGEGPVRAETPTTAGIFQTGQHFVEEAEDRGVIGSGSSAAVQLGQQYETASYGTLRAYAKAMSMDEVVGLLQQTLEEERSEDEPTCYPFVRFSSGVEDHAPSGHTAAGPLRQHLLEAARRHVSRHLFATVLQRRVGK